MTYEVIKKKNVSLPITLTEARAQLNLEEDFIEDDLLLTGYIQSAERFCSGLLGSDVAETTVTHKITNFLGGTIRVKENPLKSFTSVTHYDADEVETIIDLSLVKIQESQYFFDITLPAEYGAEDEKIVMVYVTGDIAEDIQADIKNAIQIKVATLYDHERENYADYKLKSNRAITSLLSTYMRLL